MLNRKYIIFSLIAVAVSAGFFASLRFTNYHPIVTCIIYLAFIASTINVLLYIRCPHCGRRGLRFNPFGKDAGYCSRCGKRVEFED